MKNNRAALRYAKAALSIALDQGTADALEQDMIGIVDVCSSNKDLIAFLENPILSTQTKKQKIVLGMIIDLIIIFGILGKYNIDKNYKIISILML